MSFILDAIKKSEDERQRSKQPDVHSLQNSGVYTVAPQRRFVRSFILLVALVMLIGICSWLWPQIQRQFTAVFFQLFILKSKSKSIFPTRAYVQVEKMDFDIDFKTNR